MNNYNLDIGSWCPYTKYNPSKPEFMKGDYSTVEEGSIHAAFRHSSPEHAMPPAPVHGGLFSDEETHNPWNAIPVTATMTNYIQNNLRSANPPPGATEQYVGTPRMGNNYVPMPGVYWYNPLGDKQGQHRIKTTHQCEQRSYDEKGLPQFTNDKYTYTPVLLQNKDANLV